MPKMKTSRAVAKRFQRTATGYKHKRTGKNHLFIGKPPKRKRQLRGFHDLSNADKKRIGRLLPYGDR